MLIGVLCCVGVLVGVLGLVGVLLGVLGSGGVLVSGGVFGSIEVLRDIEDFGDPRVFTSV